MHIRNTGYYKKKHDPMDRYERNDWIKARELWVIGIDGESLGLLTKEKALEIARKDGLDLVVISKTDEKCVAKIVDWAKFKYLQSKKKKKQSKSVALKEWWFYPKITDHDIENKLSNVEKYLKKGGKVKLTVKFKKRAEYDDMRDTMERVMKQSEPFSETMGEVNREGKNLSIFLKYKKQQKNEEQNQDTQSDSEKI